MDEKLSTFLIYSKPLPLKYVHSKLTSKLGTLKARRNRFKTQNNSQPQARPQKTFHSVSHNQIRQNNLMLSPFVQGSDHIGLVNAFNPKLFRQRCQNIKNVRKRKNQVSLLETLPILSPKFHHKTAKAKFLTIDTNFSSSFHVNQAYECNGNQLSPNGTVLTLDIAKLPHQPDKPPKTLRNRLNIDTTLNKLRNLRKQQFQISSSALRRQRPEDFELKPWDSKQDLSIF